MSVATNEEKALELMEEAVSEAKWAVRYLILHMFTFGAGAWILFTGRPVLALVAFGGASVFCSIYSGRLMRRSQDLRNEADRIMGIW